MKQLFFVGLMAIAFAGCSGDNAYDNGGGNPIEGDQFMAVKLVMSGDAASTRAFGDAGFEAGTEDEVGVTKATFLFFDGETQVADPFTTSELNQWTAGTGQVDKVSASIIVLSNAIKNPTSIVAILNPTTEISSAVTRNTTITQLKAIQNDYSKNTTAKNFVMSNSVYNKNGQNVIGAPCTTDNIRKTQEEAKQHPVKIAVEKVVAKVNVTKASNMKVETNPTGHNNEVNVNGATKKIDAEITGWWLDNTNSTSYLIKKLDATYDAPIGATTWWNDETNYRSYWATPAVGTFTHYAYTTANMNDKYCLENTKQDTPTQIVVAATLKVDGTPVELVKYLSVLYTKSDFEDELTKQLSNKYYTQTGTGTTTYTALTKDNLDFTYNAAAGKPYEAEIKVALKNGVSVFTSTTPSDPNSYTSADTTILNKDLDDLKRTVQYWKDGKTYYYLPIVHNEDITVTATSSAAEHKLYGVIRNHLYKLTIKSINGLGTPVPNPDEPTTPITPEKPEDDNSYIAAQIEILKYKVVTQDVDLGL